MLFGKRIEAIFCKEHFEAGEYLGFDYYTSGILEDLIKFQNKDIDDSLEGNSFFKLPNYRLKLDNSNYKFSCSISNEGVITLSVGVFLTIDTFATYVAARIYKNDFVENENGYPYIKERFAVYSDYSFVHFLRNFKIGEEKASILFHCFPFIPINSNGFHLHALISNLMLSYIVLHELSHINCGHFDVNLKHNKFIELEADVYAVNCIFQSFFCKEFHAPVSFLCEDETSLYYLLVSVILATHSILRSIEWTEGVWAEKSTTHPSAACRTINIMTSIQSAILITNSMNSAFNIDRFYTIDHYTETANFALVLLNLDFALRDSQRLSLLLMGTATIVFSPINTSHGSFEYPGLTREQLETKIRIKLISFWMWRNHVLYEKESMEFQKAFREWQNILREGEQFRMEFWNDHKELNVKNVKEDPILISLSRFFWINIDNLNYAMSKEMNVEKLRLEAEKLVNPLCDKLFSFNK